ncbi:GNAT family N-acetyltransferase [Devosia sp.]|uniref:GNAT family N-acetyltransferase n=1 Tax=Devosia sp. TaxID=1871048 RepID=UPI003266EDF4
MNIINLRDARGFFPVVADRIWNAFWQPAPLSAVETALHEVIAAAEFPFTLAALDGEQFLGTVTCIASDMDERPLLGPWIAALWVEPEARKSGVARTLVDTAVVKLLSQGNRSIYLYCKPQMREFYVRLGWEVLEDEVGEGRSVVFVRHAHLA